MKTYAEVLAASEMICRVKLMEKDLAFMQKPGSAQVTLMIERDAPTGPWKSSSTFNKMLLLDILTREIGRLRLDLTLQYGIDP